MFEKLFKLSENKTSVKTELTSGAITFLTMSYIIFVQPAVLSGAMFNMNTGMDFSALTAATCISSALATFLMGVYANYPIALAPGMGENFFFVFTAIPAAAAAGFINPWQTALGAVFISGIIFFIFSLIEIRNVLFNSISPSLKNGIAVGIGLFISFIGLQNASLIIKDAGTIVKLNVHFNSPDLILFYFGLLATAIFYVRKIKGAILWGIISHNQKSNQLSH
ncbi:MAG TPA: NCS2 family permease [bacterium]|nr:NCS2 family permease [bacterium]HPN32647.1 NCS2 family permease [bacterium]